MMNLKEFQEKITFKMADLYPESIINFEKIEKGAGVIEECMTVSHKNETIHPLINLTSFYAEFVAGKTIEEIISDIEIILNNPDKLDFNPENFTDFEKAKGKIVYRLMNYSRSKALLEDVPYRKFLNVAIVYYYYKEAENNSEDSFSILIRNKNLESWDVTEEDLFELAHENTPRFFPVEINSLFGIITKLFDEIEEGKESLEMDDCFGDKASVITNKSKSFGAVTLLYDDVIKEFSEKMKSDLYIIPSSVHECILLACTDLKRKKKKEFMEMQHDVNSSMVEPKDRLTDMLYYYSREKDTIEIA